MTRLHPALQRLIALSVITLSGCTEYYFEPKPDVTVDPDLLDTDIAVSPEIHTPTVQCNATPAIVSTLGGTSAFSATGDDPRGGTLTYTWTLTAVPTRSVVGSLDAGSDPTPVAPDLAGTYVAEVIAMNEADEASEPCVASFVYQELPRLTATPSPLDFGPVALGEESEELLILENTGNVDVTLSDILSSSTPYTPTPSTASLRPGDEVEVPVTFEPAAPGPAQGSIIILSTAPELSVDVLGEGTAEGPVAVCAAVPATISTAGGTTTLLGAGSYDPQGGALTYVWSLTSAPTGSMLGLTGSGRDRGPLTPEVAGTYTAELVVINDLGLQSAPCETSFELLELPMLDLSPDPLDFGSRAVFSTTSRPLTLSNVGNVPVTIQQVLSSDADFVVQGSNPVPLAPGATMPIPVRFTPTDMGGANGLVTVVSDAPDTSAVVLGNATAQPPVAVCDATPDVLTAPGQSTTLVGSTSSDPQGRPLTYDWTLTSRPAGSSTSLSGLGTGADRGPVMPDAIGRYTAELVVTNDLGLSSAPCTTDFEVVTGPQPPVDDCDGVSDLIYVIERDYGELYTFDPATLSLNLVGEVDCDWIGTPASMAVGRDGHALVRWSDQTLYDYDLATGSCTQTPYSAGAFGAFGMGYATDSPTTWQDTLYIANGNTLAVLDTQTWQRRTLGTMTSQSELTGNAAGELWAFLPLERKLQRRSTTTGAAMRTMTLGSFPAATGIDTFAFATWGGEFWLFVREYGVGSSSDVYRVTANGQMTLEVARLGIDIVGAGVSTCASAAP